MTERLNLECNSHSSGRLFGVAFTQLLGETNVSQLPLWLIVTALMELEC